MLIFLTLFAVIARKIRSLKSVKVYVEGNIGVGKSSVLDLLSSKGVMVIKEPVQEWKNFEGYNMLGIFYSNPGDWAMTFQVMVMITMWGFKCVSKQVVYERSPYSAVHVFAAMQYGNNLIRHQDFVV